MSAGSREKSWQTRHRDWVLRKLNQPSSNSESSWDPRNTDRKIKEPLSSRITDIYDNYIVNHFTICLTNAYLENFTLWCVCRTNEISNLSLFNSLFMFFALVYIIIKLDETPSFGRCINCTLKRINDCRCSRLTRSGSSYVRPRPTHWLLFHSNNWISLTRICIILSVLWASFPAWLRQSTRQQPRLLRWFALLLYYQLGEMT